MYSPPISKPIRSAFLIILVLGTAVRLVGIDAPLYGDELATVSLWAQMPLHEIPSHYEYANNHIFHTLLLAVILKGFGLHPILLRLPVLVCGIASLALAFFTAHRVTQNATAGLASSFLLAVSGGHIFYSTTARGYMLILLIAQFVLHRLVVWFDESELSGNVSEGALSSRELLLMTALMMAGTWTLPTFGLFEGSLMVFFAGSLLCVHHGRWFDFSFPHTRIVVVLLVCFAGFLIQYYILISTGMREMALSSAAQTDPVRFPMEMLQEWTRPFEFATMIFMFLATVGLYILFQINRNLFYLVACVLILPSAGIYAVCGLGGLPAPHARILFYLQPVFVLSVVIGAFALRYRMEERLGEIRGRAAGRILSWTVVTLLAALSGKELVQVTWPDRSARQPFDRVAEFAGTLGPNDLILLSSRPHVEFYLYGAGEMRERVERILDEGKLGDIWFVEYGEAGESDTEAFVPGRIVENLQRLAH
ncbi:hypothetical protein UR09_02485, partial [Candidatus Nitromaritima sp. SCGC AAA799-A02]